MNDEILLRHVAGRTTPREELALQRWLRESPDHERQYHEMAALLRAAREADHRWRGAGPPTAAEVIKLAEGDLAAGGSRPGAPRSIRRRFFVRAAAAAAVVAAATGARVLSHSIRSSHLPVTEFVAGPAESSTVNLDDGTVVRLAASSRLRLYDRSNAREVFLSGRAFFAVRGAR